MPKVSKKELIQELTAKVESLEAELEALREFVNEQAASPSVQLVREIKPPEPLSQPLDAHQLWYEDHVVPGSYPYNPASDDWRWGGVYL